LSEVKQTKEHQVIIGLGSNISPAENLKSALYLLGRYAPIQAISEVWQTRAVGSKGPDFLNAAVLISSPLSYDELRNQILRPIENLLGRVRTKDPNSPHNPMTGESIQIIADRLIESGSIKHSSLELYRTSPT
jgi:hypothetical protein